MLEFLSQVRCFLPKNVLLTLQNKFQTQTVLAWLSYFSAAKINCSSPITLYEGENFTCVCRGIGGNPPANVTWYDKDGVQIGETGIEEQTLNLTNVNGTDIGTYKCVAQDHVNATNETSIDIIVKLNCKYD
jgi:hypothetical protein